MRQSYQLRRWPDTPAFQSVAKRWCVDQSYLLMDLVWRAIDVLVDQDIIKVPVEVTDEAKEESLNNMMHARIDQLKSGDEPFAVVHQPPEQSSRKTPNAQSPTPDLSFTWYENLNCVWPIEGKVLDNENDLDAYGKEITENYETERYGAFSSEGAMLGYLLTGDPAQVLKNIAKRISKRLVVHPQFLDRDHRISKHKRRRSTGTVSTSFNCHHLVFLVGHQSADRPFFGKTSHQTGL